MRAYKNIREIGVNTTKHYSDISSKLFLKYGRKDKRGIISEKYPESLVDRTTSRELGIQENDLWMALLAVERNMKFVTEDKMRHIKEVFPELKMITWRKEK